MAEDEVSSVMIDGIRHLPPRRSELYDLGDIGYVLGKKIGEGTYARVHKAYYYDSKKGIRMQLACKIFDIKCAPKVFCTSFFPRELSIIASLNHKHVVGVHSILLRGTKFFVFMKYGEKGDLLAYIRQKGPMKERNAKVWYGQIVSALQYLHARNIVHRDLKCENIIITSRFNLKLGDFGFATINSKNEQSRTFCGSLAYACPEITRGIPYCPRLADCWSSGVILFIMLNATMPFHERNINKLIACQMSKTYVHKYKREEILSRDVIRLIDKILEPNPARRYTLMKIINHSWLKEVHVTLSPAGNGINPNIQQYFKKMIESIDLNNRVDESPSISLDSNNSMTANTPKMDTKLKLPKYIKHDIRTLNEDKRLKNVIMEANEIHKNIYKPQPHMVYNTADNKYDLTLSTKLEKEKAADHHKKKKNKKALTALATLKTKFQNKQCGTEKMEKCREGAGCGGGGKISWCGLSTKPLGLTPMRRKNDAERELYHLKPITIKQSESDEKQETDKKQKTYTPPEKLVLRRPKQMEEGGGGRKLWHITIKPKQQTDSPWAKMMKKIKQRDEEGEGKSKNKRKLLHFREHKEKS